MADFAATFGEYPGVFPTWNYPVTYNGKTRYNGQVAIGFNPISNVPGLGTVNISQTLNAEINEAQPSTWAQYTWDWARLVQPEPAVPPALQQRLSRGLFNVALQQFPSDLGEVALDQLRAMSANRSSGCRPGT